MDNEQINLTDLIFETAVQIAVRYKTEVEISWQLAQGLIEGLAAKAIEYDGQHDSASHQEDRGAGTDD